MIKHALKLLVITLLFFPNAIKASDVKIVQEITVNPWLLNITSIRYGLDKITYVGDGGFSTSQKQFKKNTQFIIIKGELKSNSQTLEKEMKIKCKLIVNSSEEIGYSYVKMKDNKDKRFVGDFLLKDVKREQFPIEVSLYFMEVPLSADTIHLSVNGSEPIFITSILKDLQRRLKIIGNQKRIGSE